MSNEAAPASDPKGTADAHRQPDEQTADALVEDVGLYPDEERKTFTADYYS
jgi:hypothetical protein